MFSPACPPNLLHPSDQPRSCATRVEDRQLGSAPTAPSVRAICASGGRSAAPQPLQVARTESVEPSTLSPKSSGADAHRPVYSLFPVEGVPAPSTTQELLDPSRQSATPRTAMGRRGSSVVEMVSIMTTAHVCKGQPYVVRQQQPKPTEETAGFGDAGSFPAVSRHIVRPDRPLGLVTDRKDKGQPMPRPSLASLPLLEGIEAYERQLVRMGSDGVIDSEEYRQLVRTLRPLVRKCARVHDSLSFVDLLIHGNGIDGDWIQRKMKGEMKNRLHVITADDDRDPEPSGPMAAKEAA